ncbi:Exosome complex component RRP43 [Spatholobus suberectus]|nr:Exosome complex component RRP43 [Spatholobus suberectus]
MGLPNASEDLSSEMEVDAFRCLFPLRYFECHLAESIRPDGRPLGKARETSIFLGAVASANGSALVKIGSTTMLTAIKMEVMTSSLESPDEGCIGWLSLASSAHICHKINMLSAIAFHMPPICSPIVRPGRPAEASPVVSKQLSDTISKHVLISRMIDLKELSLVSGKAAWMAYLDVYCLDADGALFDAVLLSAVAALSHLLMSDEDGQKQAQKPVNKKKRKLTLRSIPFSLTCILHKNYILADPTAEEESIMETNVTIVWDTSGQLISLYKPGGPVLAYTSAIQDCAALTRQRVKELKSFLDKENSAMEV